MLAPPGRIERPGRGTAQWGRHRLAADSVEGLRTVGTFGTVDAKDLVGAFSSARRATAAVAELRKAGLLRVQRLRTGGRVVEAVTLTGAGKRLMERHVDPRQPDDEHAQLYRAGPVRRSQALHDTAVYRAVRLETRALEARGGRVLRVRTEADLQRLAWRRIQGATAAGKPREDARVATATELGLALHDGRLAFPDARVEYTEAGSGQGVDRGLHLDVEVVTRDYRGPALRAKVTAGFRIYSMDTAGAVRVGNGQ